MSKLYFLATTKIVKFINRKKYVFAIVFHNICLNFVDYQVFAFNFLVAIFNQKNKLFRIYKVLSIILIFTNKILFVSHFYIIQTC